MEASTFTRAGEGGAVCGRLFNHCPSLTSRLAPSHRLCRLPESRMHRTVVYNNNLDSPHWPLRVARCLPLLPRLLGPAELGPAPQPPPTAVMFTSTAAPVFVVELVLAVALVLADVLKLIALAVGERVRSLRPVAFDTLKDRLRPKTGGDKRVSVGRRAVGAREERGRDFEWV